MFIVWRHKNCFSPSVATPDGGGYTLSSIVFNYACADPTQFIPNQPFVLAPHSLPSGTTADPVISIGYNDRIDHSKNVPSDRAARTYIPVGQPLSVSSADEQVRLNYCSELQTHVLFKTVANSLITDVPASQFDGQNISQTGGCPVGYGEVGHTTYIGLSDTPARGETVSLAKQFVLTFEQENVIYKAETSQVPIPIDARGNAKHTVISATIRCYQLTVGDAAVLRTAANCPGGGIGLYLPGSTVQVDAIVNSPAEFREWTGTTAGDSADSQSTASSIYLLMASDRTVNAVTAVPGWQQMAQTFTSNIARRIVAFGMDVLVNQLLGKIAFTVANFVNLGLKGIAAGLGAIGVSGKVVDGISKAGAAVDLAVGQLSNLSKCTTAWATNSDVASSAANDIVGRGAAALGQGAGGVSGVNAVTGYVLGNGDAIRRTQAAAIDNKLKNAGDISTGIGVALSLYTTFGTSVGSYFNGDPKNSWTSFGNSIGTCMTNNINVHLGDIQ